MPKTPDTFALRLRGLREAAGLSREGLAESSGVSYGALVCLEQGTRLDPRISTLRKLAKALGVPVGDLLVEAPVKRKSE